MISQILRNPGKLLRKCHSVQQTRKNLRVVQKSILLLPSKFSVLVVLDILSRHSIIIRTIRFQKRDGKEKRDEDTPLLHQLNTGR